MGPTEVVEEPRRLRPLPLVVAVIAAATAIPVELRHPALAYVSWSVAPLDVMLNVLLFAPLGFALGARPRLALALCILSPVAIEVAQLGFASRLSSPVDVVANALGGSLGIVAYRIGSGRRSWAGRGLPLGRSAALTALLGGALILVVVSLPGRPADFSNWDPGCGLAIGDELTGGRPWDGTLLEGALYDRAPDRASIGLAGNRAGAPVFRQAARPRVILPAFGGDSATPAGRSLLAPPEAARLTEDLREAGRLTLVARLRTSNPRQSGPARIVTFSKNPWERNFTLGQERREIEFRLRTPASGPNGDDPCARSPAVLPADRDVTVVAGFDGRVSRVWLDGRLVARSNLAAAGRPGKTFLDEGAPLAAVLIGIAAAIAALGWRRVRGTAARVVAGTLAGLAAGLLLLAAGGLDALPSFVPWSLALAALAGSVVGLAVRERGLGRSART